MRFRRPGVVGAVLLFYGVLAGLGLLWMGWRGDPLPERLVATGVSWIVALGFGLLAGAAVLLVTDVWLDRLAWTDLLRREILELFGPMSRRRAVWFALASGIGEEILFRGALLPFAGLVVSSVLFGALHVAPRPGLLGWTIFAVAAGFLFGGLFLVTGGVLAPAAAHALVNGVQLARLAGEDGRLDGPPGPG